MGELHETRVPIKDPNRRWVVKGAYRDPDYLEGVVVDVPFQLFRSEDCGRHGEDLHADAEGELFTEAEADAVLAWFARDGDVVEVEKMRIDTLPENVMPCHMIPTGGGLGIFCPHRWGGYDLPFKVEGWVDRHAIKLPSVSGDPAGDAGPGPGEGREAGRT